MSTKAYGPKDKHLWLNRPLGYWANQLLRDFPSLPGPKRCGINYITQIRMHNQQEIDVHLFQQAVEATVYKEPHLRTDVDLTVNPAVWVPASDFSTVFKYIDVREEGKANLVDVWPLVEDEANAKWEYGSGKPLYRCTLVRALECYVLMNYYHHAAGDGTSGMLIAGSILEQYDLLSKGLGTKIIPEVPRPSVEVYTSVYEDQALVSKMVGEMADRLANYKPYLPLDIEPDAISDKAVNKILFKDGDAEALTKLRVKCKESGVTIGALALAASYLAMAAVHAKWSCADISTYSGMKDQYVDIPVNMRPRLTPTLGNSYCGFYVTELSTKFTVDLASSLWSLAKDINSNLASQIAENRHLFFSRAKEEFECGSHKERLAAKLAEHHVDLLFSNEKTYAFQRNFDWGKVESVHTTGSWWTPGFSNYLFLFQSTDRFHYDMVYWPVGRNKEVAKQLLEYIVQLMEVLALEAKDPSIVDVLK